MTGTYSASAVVLTHGHWISEPPGYEMVDLRAGVPSGGGKIFSGNVTTAGCTTFI